ncbi:response regulator transcription factor [Actinomadura graeca]|uniref:Response regulator transcription factor n=1 Tax=Actinomadura graeca TaxID=2750812 RepID=A0ABX8QR00_9ACTN|nr:response regulator [Actinomadura graeca]QXJ21231.1 response regulator transcription factor [Actinomadura graeca]
MEEPLITAVIIDNHSVIAAGVRTWCERARPPIRLIDAGNRLARVWTGEGGEADVVVFDLCMRVEKEPEFKELDRLVRQGRRVVVFSGEVGRDSVLRCMELGAMAYVTKDEGEEHLVPAIEAVARGGTYTGPQQAGIMVTAPDRPALAESEIRALRAWCAGASIPRVAKRLGVSPRTVETYIERARKKYDDVGRPCPTKTLATLRMVEDGHLDVKEIERPQDGEV